VVASCVVSFLRLGEALRDTQSINIFNDIDSPCIAFRLRHLASCSGFADFIGPCFRLLEILVEVLLRVVGFDKLSPNLDSLRLSPLE